MIKKHKEYKVKMKFFIHKNLKDSDNNYYTVWFGWCLVIYRLRVSPYFDTFSYRENEIFIPSQVEKLKDYFSSLQKPLAPGSRISYLYSTTGIRVYFDQYQALSEYFNGRRDTSTSEGE